MLNFYGAAAYWVQKASDGMPESALVWSELGLAYARTHRPAEAMDAFSRAIAIEPNMMSAWYNRGLVQLAAGRPAEAEAECVRALEIDGGNMEIVTRIQLAHVLARRTPGEKPVTGTP